MTDSRIAVISGRYPGTSFASPENHLIYCHAHGYHYIHCNWPTRHSNRYLNKIEYIRAYAELFEYVFWIDDDAFFLNHKESLNRFLPAPDEFISICASPTEKKIHTYISSGQFFLRCNSTGVSFLDAVIETSLEDVKDWWNPELGYFTNGDQDAMVYLMKTDPRFMKYTRWPAPAFNSRIEHLCESPESVFLLHLTGKKSAKARSLATAQRVLERGPALVEQEIAEHYQLTEVTDKLTYRIKRWLYKRTV